MIDINELTKNIKDPKWLKIIKEESNRDFFKNILSFLDKEKDNYFPKKENIFKAFELTKYDDVKVVIIGQDPYHEENQAHGLAFSVENNKAPKSLQNIFKELKDDLGIDRTNANLTDLALQGVLLLNATLTVRKHQANSHSNIGWQIFTDKIIKELNKKDNEIVYILLGNFAISKKELIDVKKHYIIETSHPSFFSCNKGFFGSKIFSRTNEELIRSGQNPIKWN